MKSTVIVFPGSNCDRDICVAIEKFNFKNSIIWHDESQLPKCDLVVLPGGFSFGDYLRSGCIAAKSKIIKEVIEYANNGGLVLGICNGFQILIETGLLPGTLIRNKNLNFLCRNVFLKISNNSNKFLSKFKKEVIKLHIAHNEGNYFVTEEKLKEIENNNQIAFKYCDQNGKINSENNPNGSTNNIAGIYNKKQNILGMMPHPERMIEKNLLGDDGALFFENLLNNHK